MRGLEPSCPWDVADFRGRVAPMAINVTATERCSTNRSQISAASPR